MISRFMRYIRKDASTIPKMLPEDFKPKQFSMNLDTLGQMYTLRRWYLIYGASEHKKIEYIRDIEELHNEINLVNLRSQMIRYALFVFISMVWFCFFMEKYDTRMDFAKYHDNKFTWKLLNELDEGGTEGG